MTATWPSQIKFCPVDRAISDKSENGFYEFQPDAGAPQRLSVTTGLKKTISFQLFVDSLGRETIDDFYHSACSNGAEDFYAKDLYDNTKTLIYWWEEPPAFTCVGPNYFRVQMKLWTLTP